jgi:hypothetical protein
MKKNITLCESNSVSRFLYVIKDFLAPVLPAYCSVKRAVAVTFVFFLFFFSDSVCGQTTTVSFTSTGTWTPPAGITSVTVALWGGGGAGGGATGNPATGGGGAGGSFVTGILAVTPGTAYTVTVGAATTATTTSSAAINKGDPSWFNTAATIFAAGGDGGTPASVNSTNGAAGSGNTTGCIGTTKRAGGNGSTGNFTSGTGYSGAGGGGAGSTAIGGNASTGTGGTGTSLNGGNGANGVGNSTAGAAGLNYGGGGSGGKANSITAVAGGTGAAGFVTITYTNVNNAIFAGGSSDGFAFSSVGASGSEVSLPIELLSFNANLDGNVVDVIWLTASETNNDYFMIQRSRNGTTFEDVARVEGAGNSTAVKKYVEVDDKPYDNISYYRLKQLDFDGKYSFSNIVSVNSVIRQSPEFIVYPNPSDGTDLTIDIRKYNANEEVRIVILNMEGKSVYSKTIMTDDNGTFNGALSNEHPLSAGIYTIISYAEKNVSVVKLAIR